jgi:hypothetical protein
MNGRKAKKLRRMVFGFDSSDNRRYARLKQTGQVINVADKIRITAEGKELVTTKRALYRHLKQKSKNVPLEVIGQIVIENIKSEEIKDENPEADNSSGS